jgi:hypothetical protein
MPAPQKVLEFLVFASHFRPQEAGAVVRKAPAYR